MTRPFTLFFISDGSTDCAVIFAKPTFGRMIKALIISNNNWLHRASQIKL
jgi:hypothetical protein